MNEKTKGKLTFIGFVILGTIVMPFIACIFVIDRVIMAPMFWFEPKSFTKWVKDFELIAYSLLRTCIAIVIYETINLLT